MALVCMVMIALCGLAGCGTSSDSPATIQLQLNWMPDAQHGGFYAARTEGFYQAEGLDVQIVPGGPGTPVIPKVTMGKCDFAVGNADQILLARQQGAKLVAVFAAMQNSPRCIMVHKSSGIASFDELQNVVLALGEGKAFAEYLKSRVSLEGVRIVSYSGSVAKFLLDDGFAQQGYVFSEPIVAADRGGDPRTLMVSDLGFNPYSSVLMTRQELFLDNPDLVRRFVRATRRGWQAYLRDPTAGNRAILIDNPEMDSDILAKSVESIRPLCQPPDVSSNDLGTMTRERWQTLWSQLVELDLLPADAVKVDGAFVDVGVVSE